MHCPQCNNEIPDSCNFCPICGYNVASTDDTATPVNQLESQNQPEASAPAEQASQLETIPAAPASKPKNLAKKKKLIIPVVIIAAVLAVWLGCFQL